MSETLDRVATIDLNADAGEGFDSAELFRWISSASVACGGHAGDEVTMRATLALARASGVAVGAHPGYADRERFGRVETGESARVLATSLGDQVERLRSIAAESGVAVAYVKPHGALYHRLTYDAEAAHAVVAAIAEVDPELAVVGFPRSELLAAARAAGLVAVAEGFCDRRYSAAGVLVPRSEKEAHLGGEGAVAQAVALARGDAVVVEPEARRAGGADGADRSAGRPAIRTLCLHSDSPGAAGLARAVRQGLEREGLRVEPFVDRARVAAIPEIHVVGAAIVEGGRVLLTRRGPAMAMAGKWEFPGGKVEASEAPAAALAREVAEELGVAIEVVPGAPLGRGSALVEGRRILLEVHLARRRSNAAPRLTEHDALGWFAADELAPLDWPEADLPILPALARALSKPLS